MKNIAVISCLLCVPYLCTLLWGHSGIAGGGTEADRAVPVFAPMLSGEYGGGRLLNKDCGWYEAGIDLEEYIAQCLAAYAGEDVRPEAMKALAVVLRTGLEEGQAVPAGTKAEAVTDAYRKAARETGGIILSYEGARANALWTYVSNGMTRDGAENRLASAEYLKKRSCAKDILSKEYSCEVSVEKKRFEEILARLAESPAGEKGLERDDFGWPVFRQIRDSAGYTKKVEVGEKEIEGSVFADAFSLPSPSFDMEFEDARVVFHVTGCGHGFGMSLYEADRMASEGKDFMEILSFFYPGTELKKL